jgi:pimeloyl-ACP methyl ester carboxylesterase
VTTSFPSFDAIPIPTGIDMFREANIFADLARGVLQFPRALFAPAGRSEPVLLLPGFNAGDGSTWPMRKFLGYLGWDARGWGLGTNYGNAAELLPRVIEVADDFAQSSGQAVHLVGWSMGGFFAREVARDRPDLVAQVVTMGTPVVGGAKYTAFAPVFRRKGYDIEAWAAACASRACRIIPRRITAIYSPHDGIVSWQACIDRESPRVEHVPVGTTHFAFGFDPRVWHVVAERLAN